MFIFFNPGKKSILLLDPILEKVPTSHPPVKKFKKHEGESCGLPFGPMGHDCGECDDGLRCGLGRSPAPASCGLCYKSYKVTRG